MTWETKHSVVANANRKIVWEFHSNVDNIARVEGDAVSMTLDGPYQAGTKGTTNIVGQDPTHWQLVEVIPPERSVTEIELTEAVVRTTWTFEELPDGRTRLSQHMVLEGPGAEAYVSVMEEMFAGNIVKGMEKIAAEIVKYAAGR